MDQEQTQIVTDYRKLAQWGLEQLSEWDSIAAVKKNEIITEFSSFFSCEERDIANKLNKGRHLIKLRQLLGYGNFTKAAKIFNLNIRTAQRIIEMCEKVEKTIPTPVLAMAPPDLGGTVPGRPMGRYTEAIKMLPPPKTDDKVKIRQWWGKIAEKAAEEWGVRHKTRTKPKELVLRQLYLDISRRLRQVNPKSRAEVFEAVVGMLLAELGISSRKHFEPKAVPADFNVKRGRPKKVKEEVKAGAKK